MNLHFLCGRVGSDEGGDYSLSSLEVFVACVRCTCRYFARVQEKSGGRGKTLICGEVVQPVSTDLKKLLMVSMVACLVGINTNCSSSALVR